MSIDLTELRGIFFDEAYEHLGIVESALLALEHQPGDRELLNQVFRAAHSIKGGSGTFGFTDLLRFTHALEGLLHLLRDGVMHLDAALADLLLRATDVLRAVVDATRAGEAAPAALDVLLAEIEHATPKQHHDVEGAAVIALPDVLFAPGPPAPAVPTRSVRVLFSPGPNLFRQGMDPLLVVRDLLDLARRFELVLDTAKLPDLESLDPEVCHLAWSVTMTTDRAEAEIRDVFAFVEDTSRIEVTWLDELEPHGVAAALEAPSAPVALAQHPAPVAAEGHAPAAAASAQARATATAERSTVRVDTFKIDKLIDLVGELVIAQSMVNAALGDADSPGATDRLRDAVLAMDRNTRELQDRVMAVRMLPVGSVFNRFPRMVRDLSTALGKRTTLTMTGEEIELDKGMVEKLADPLTHLVRNAIDHGLETPDERRAQGKPEEGTVSILAVHTGGNVVIEVCDDGRGLPLDRIRDKARQLGLLPKDVEPSVEQLHDIIFAPGFSTKEHVTDVSGRGVGMDVVKRNVEALNGSLSFTSEPGKGSRMRIRLPLTMAIIDGLTLRIGTQVFVVPLIEIVESMRPTAAQVQSVLGRGEIIRVRDQAIPLLRLHAILGIEGAQTDPRRALVCIAETRTTPVGLLVDEILGQAQVVVKTLETNFQRIDGVMGATILGDGRVALILDVQALARRAATIDAGRRGDAGIEPGAADRAA